MESTEDQIKKFKTLIDTKKYIEVISLLNDKYLQDQNNGELYYWRGLALMYLNRFDNALEDFSKTIQINPMLSKAYVYRAKLLLTLEQYDKAMDDANESIRLESANAIGYEVRGLCWRKLKKYDKALQDFNTAINLDSFNEHTFHNRALIWVDLNNYNKALEDHNKALYINPKNLYSLTSRSSLLGILGQNDQAIADLDEVLQMDEKYSPAYYVLGAIYFNMHKYSLASCYIKRSYYLRNEWPHTAYIPPNFLDFFSKGFNAPFLLHEILINLIDLNNLKSYHKDMMFSEMTCSKWLMILKYCNILANSILDRKEYLRLCAIVNYYMQNEIKSFNIYKYDLDKTELEIRDLYYFLSSANMFLEPNEDILQLSIERISKKKSFLDEDLYYSGQIFLQNKEYAKAEAFFLRANNFLPALYGLAGLYKIQNRLKEVNELASEIKKIENPENKLLSDLSTIKLDLFDSFEIFKTEFSKRLFYFELIEEIILVEACFSSNKPLEHLEFHNLIEIDGQMETKIQSKIDLNDSKIFERELIDIFCKTSNSITLHQINKEIQNNADAKKIILQVENNIERFETSTEKELAIAIRQFKEPASWYILLIKYFYLTHRLGPRVSVMLHFYVLKIAQQKKNNQNIKIIETEIKSWVKLISVILKSPTVIMLLNKFWTQVVVDKPKLELDQYEDYRYFKKKFRLVFLPWWRDSICKMELEKKGFSFEV
jgi:tetratricopeptide (TPR) repeat protein